MEEEQNKKESIYDEEGREELVADGEISPEEAGFMAGYEAASEDKPDEIDADSDEDDEE